jgi:putative ABC transport system ATP-binding protein
MIRILDVTKRYRLGEQVVVALDGVSLDIEEGEFVAVMGPSGSGKSTLMNMMGALDKPTTGVLEIGGRNLATLNSAALADLRNSSIGFVFQQFNLLPRTTALRQVMLPMSYGPKAPARPEAEARRLLEMVGMGDRVHHTPAQLSGGQQQRVAIARALANEPKLILADEPTGALDTATGAEIMRLLKMLNAKGITVIIVTHEPDIAAHAARQIRVRDGKIVSDERSRPVAAKEVA